MGQSCQSVRRQFESEGQSLCEDDVKREPSAPSREADAPDDRPNGSIAIADPDAALGLDSAYVLADPLD